MYDWLIWLLSAGLGREKLALLVLCTVVIYGLAAQLAWRVTHGGTGKKVVVALAGSWFGRWLAQALRLCYYVGIPLAVLLRGESVSLMSVPTTYAGEWDGDAVLRLLSLVGVRDVAHFAAVAAIAGGGLCLLIVVWVWYVRAVPGLENAFSAAPWWKATREAVFMQMLWALYRGFLSTLTANGIYVAFASLALLSLSWLLNPQRRHDLFTPRGYAVVRDWVFALLTAFAALRVNSLWLLMMMHGLWFWVSDRVVARFSSIPQRGSVLGAYVKPR